MTGKNGREIHVGIPETNKSESLLKNEGSLEKIPDEARPYIREMVEKHSQHWGEKLESVYVYGSIANGSSIEGKPADIDALGVIRGQRSEVMTKENEAWAADMHEEMWNRYGISIDFTFMDDDSLIRSKRQRYWALTLRTNGVRVAGNDMDRALWEPEKLEQVAEVLHLGMTERVKEAYESAMNKEDSAETWQKEGKYMAKSLLRLTRSWTLLHGGEMSNIPEKQIKILNGIYPDAGPELEVILRIRRDGARTKEEYEMVSKAAFILTEDLDKRLGIKKKENLGLDS